MNRSNVNFVDYFSEVSAPRRETKNKLHKLKEILVLVILAVIKLVDLINEQIAWIAPFIKLMKENMKENNFSKHVSTFDTLDENWKEQLSELNMNSTSIKVKVLLHIKELLIRSATDLGKIERNEFAVASFSTFTSSDNTIDLNKIYQSTIYLQYKTLWGIFGKELTTWTQKEIVALWENDLCKLPTKLLSCFSTYNGHKIYLDSDSAYKEWYFNDLTLGIE